VGIAVGAQHGRPHEPDATPTIDRLAAPPTVQNPSQADIGAQVYWLNCQPCHGDQGQGLTDEWRAQYPPEDQNCWHSGCHGKLPYEGGFTLPQTVPAVVGPSALARFQSAAGLHAFIRQAMPFQAPGSLKPDEYWALTAFLVRAQGVSESVLPLNEAKAATIGLHGPLATGTPIAPAPAPVSRVAGLRLTAIFATLAAVLGALAVWLRWRTRTK
jgi:mono/diheme cytochrome c family protein